VVLASAAYRNEVILLLQLVLPPPVGQDTKAKAELAREETATHVTQRPPIAGVDGGGVVRS